MPPLTTTRETSTAPVEDPTSADADGDEIAAGGLTVTAVNIATGTVTITNKSAADADLMGHQLCNRPNFVLLPGQILTAGENIEVSLGGLSAGGGEVGLYTSGDFASSDDLISYVTWGSGGGRLSVA